ncbi:MAG: phosphate acyltransferase PlsX [Eubacteriales bacterium]|nr:phosphate acyltransferase PlsX [Eubacteriales bacterium]
MRIVLDAMGGDNAPDEIVKGALKAQNDFKNTEIVLVGDENQIKKFIPEGTNIEIIHTSETIGMDEDPLKAIKTKKNSSMVVGLDMVKKGEADAFVSAGSTGALIVGASLHVGRIRGIRRVALGTVLPNNNKGCILLDCGATMDCSAEFLTQFAFMGSIYMEQVIGVDNPRVGLLNVGVEEIKGNDVVKSAYNSIANTSLNFIGNVEARQFPDNACDVLIADGFAGNVMLKAIEGTAGMMTSSIKAMLRRNTISMIAALMLKGGLKEFKKMLDYKEHGGAPLLGANGAIIKAHGSSDARAIYNAIRQAIGYCEGNVTEKIENYLKNQ